MIWYGPKQICVNFKPRTVIPNSVEVGSAHVSNLYASYEGRILNLMRWNYDALWGTLAFLILHCSDG
jgi:hypothetical protein